jgi:hypothetical protein
MNAHLTISPLGWAAATVALSADVDGAMAKPRKRKETNNK